MPRTYDRYASLRIPEFRYWLGVTVFATLTSRALLWRLGIKFRLDLSVG